MNTAFNPVGWINDDVVDKLESGARLEGDEAAAWVACQFSNATNNHYPADGMLGRTLIGSRYRLTVEKI